MENPLFKTINRYRFAAFSDHILMRSKNALTAGKAWAALRKCWTGYKMSQDVHYTEGMVFYAKGVNKYLYLLEEIPREFEILKVK